VRFCVFGKRASIAIDPNGNTTSKTASGVTTNFLFDIRDQLGEVRQGASVLGRYGYDYDGRRILKIGDDGRRQYTYDQLSVVTEADQLNATVSKYDYGMDQLVRLDNRGEGRSFFHLDFLGSTVGLTDAAGGARQSIFYDAWGNERDRIGTSANRFTFTGHEFDFETGLIYAKARFYDPDIGRFLTQDSFLGASDRPPSLHRYFYSFSNPLRFYDPDGFAPRTAEAMLQQRIDEIHQQTGTPKQLIALSLAGQLSATGLGEQAMGTANALTLGGAGGVREGLEEGDISARQGFFESVYATGSSFLSGNVDFIVPGAAEYRTAREQGAGVGQAAEAGVGGAFAVPELQGLFGRGRTAGERFDAGVGVAFKGLRLFVIGKLLGGARGGATTSEATVVTESRTQSQTVLETAKTEPSSGSLKNRSGDVELAANTARSYNPRGETLEAPSPPTSIGASVEVPSAQKFVPNPYGKLGSPAHRAKVAEVRSDIEARGLIAETEVPIRTVGGAKATRSMDVVARDPATGQIVEVHQVGRVLKSDPLVPVSRERQALRDVRYSPELRAARRFFKEY
jgi:RHS repeat-associated protein